MSITNQGIKRIAELSKLSFKDSPQKSQDQISNFTKEFNSIIKMVDTLKKVDTSHIDPLEFAPNTQATLRPDAVMEEELQKELFSNYQGVDSDLAKKLQCFIVPKVIEIE